MSNKFGAIATVVDGDLHNRFWGRVDDSGGPDACWPWQGGRYGEDRYGAIAADLGDGRKVHGTHRVAFLLTGGVLTNEKPHVLHSCDNKICCNPAHLSAGNHSENIQQAHDRGLIRCSPRKGRSSQFAKLSESDVRAIRSRLSQGESRRTLASEYGLSKSGMDHIAAKRTWRHV